MTVLFVEHDMDMVHDISDWVVVMAEGEVIAEGTPDDIVANTAVIDADLGAPVPGLLDRLAEAHRAPPVSVHGGEVGGGHRPGGRRTCQHQGEVAHQPDGGEAQGNTST